MLPFLTKGFMAVVLIVILSSCSVLKNVENNTGLELALKLAVMELIEKEEVSAVDVIETVESVDKFLDKNSSARVSDLMGHVRSKVSWDKLTISQHILISAIIDGVEERLAAKVSEGLISEDSKATVKEVLSWVNEAASMVAARNK